MTNIRQYVKIYDGSMWRLRLGMFYYKLPRQKSIRCYINDIKHIIDYKKNEEIGLIII